MGILRDFTFFKAKNKTKIMTKLQRRLGVDRSKVLFSDFCWMVEWPHVKQRYVMYLRQSWHLPSQLGEFLVTGNNDFSPSCKDVLPQYKKSSSTAQVKNTATWGFWGEGMATLFWHWQWHWHGQSKKKVLASSTEYFVHTVCSVIQASSFLLQRECNTTSFFLFCEFCGFGSLGEYFFPKKIRISVWIILYQQHS